MPEKMEEADMNENSFELQDMLDYEMVDFEASHDADIKQMLRISDTMTHKLAFTVFSVLVALIGYIIGSIPQHFFVYHTITTLILLSYRWYSYKTIKNHYFMFDFCYYTNHLLLFYLWSPWHFGFLFPILFSLSNGPLLWSVLLWRNSLVPHSVDKMTSLLLHFSPPLTVYGLRWHSEEEQGFLLCSQPSSKEAGSVHKGCGDIGWVELILSPILCSLIWVAFYYVIVLVWRAERVKQRQYVHSFTYLVENAKKKPIVKLVHMFGPDYKRSMYLVWHVIYILVSIIITYYSYFSQTYNLFLICIVLIIACYNGASFYIDVIGRLYYLQQKEKDANKE